jgi:uncharacterized protein YyaL (SSP411 family)
MDKTLTEKKANRLIREKSPYLLKHAYNPVDWYPWCEEAIKKAKNDFKPILLSIGYSSCHWCNVMEKESFEDEEVATIINKNFVPIKVDREERPEIDKIYMAAVQAMTGNGGWPLTVFLTPDLKPFFGGTYFPPESRYGLPGFKQVLEYIAKMWKEKREEIVSSSSEIMNAISSLYSSPPAKTPERGVLDEAFELLVSSYDEKYGGFSIAPKFPLPCTLNFLLHYSYRAGKQLALNMVRNTLFRICLGGIRDHIGGGFHRYSTDRFWLVPHFEKMLYDNALLSYLLINAYRVTGEELFSNAAKESLGWMLREMMSKEGGFYTAQDADTADGEGFYYTWTPEEIRSVLGSKYELFCRVYGISSKGNFEGRSIPNLVYSSPENIILSNSKDFNKMKSELYEARLKRNKPLTDDKILVSWNGLAISALANAYQLFGDEVYVKAAEKAASFIKEKMWDGERIRRVYKDGVSSLPGTLEDYSFMIQGLIDLYESTYNEEHLKTALEYCKAMQSKLKDEKGGFFFEEEGVAGLRLKESHDGPTPSGNSVAAMDLIRLAEVTGDQELKESVKELFSAFGKRIESDPAGHTWMLSAYDLYLNGLYEVVITAKRLSNARRFVEKINERYIPDKVLIVAYESNFKEISRITKLLDSKEPKERPAAYLCKNFTCLLPTEDPEKLIQMLTKRD